MAKTLEKKATAKSAKPVPQEQLEVAAYFHWLNRGCPSNDSLADWLEVEKEMNHLQPAHAQKK